MFSPGNPFCDHPDCTCSLPARESTPLSVWVPGVPRPQGSKNYMGRTRAGKPILKESSAGLPAWRSDVRDALVAADTRLAGAVSVGLEFVMPRPQRARSGDPADRQPDLDKLARGVLDCLTSAGVIEDDARVVNFHRLSKRLAEPGEVPGCRITVRRWAP